MATARQLKRAHRAMRELDQQAADQCAARAVLEIQRQLEEDETVYEAWQARYIPARQRLEQQIKDFEQEGNDKLAREFGAPPSNWHAQKKLIKSLGKKFPHANWTAVLVEKLGGPAQAAAAVSRDERTIRASLRRPMGRMCFGKLAPIARAAGVSEGLMCDLVKLQLEREKRTAKRHAAA
jgi:hypothetical protein